MNGTGDSGGGGGGSGAAGTAGRTDRQVRFVDTTLRDGSQSLWAMGMRHGMMAPIAADMDRAGFHAVEVIANPIFFKKIVRDLKEDPWVTLRMLAERMPRTRKTGMGLVTAPGAPPVVNRLAMQLTADLVRPYRVQTVCNTRDELARVLPTTIPLFKELGLETCIGVSFSISPRHTDDLFVDKARTAAALSPDALYLKDQGGLLTVDRVRSLVPRLLEAAGDLPLELHSHCTTGLAPAVYAEALRLGIRCVHTGIPPAADGSAQPSVLDVAHNARVLGLDPVLDEPLVRDVARRLDASARAEGLPPGEPSRYDEAQFVHQIPGGVISNLRFQLAAIGLEDRLGEVVEESVHVRADLGYPIMITPFSQYVVTQSTLNVVTGERYRVAIDEVIRFAQGDGGVDSGYLDMDQDLRDRLCALPRARELAAQRDRPPEDLTVRQAKERYGTVTMSDEELVLRAIMQGTDEIDAMRQAGPPRRFASSDLPLVRLLRDLDRHRAVTYVHVQRGGDRLLALRPGPPSR